MVFLQRDIHNAIPKVPLTLHGGSGIAEGDIKASLSLGMSNVHVNTEIRVAFSDTLRDELMKNDQTTPYKYLKKPQEAAQKIVARKLKLFKAENIA